MKFAAMMIVLLGMSLGGSSSSSPGVTATDTNRKRRHSHGLGLRVATSNHSLSRSHTRGTRLIRGPRVDGDPSRFVNFVHIPKAGGASMYTALAILAAELGLDDRKRTCAAFAADPSWPPPWFICPAIVGGKRHLPWLSTKRFEGVPCVTMLREPGSRLVSGWWYYGHQPNTDDFLSVRTEFNAERKRKLAAGVTRLMLEQHLNDTWSFEEYLAMPEYRDIATRMFGADSHPYRNVTVDSRVFAVAKTRLLRCKFVGILEAPDTSIKLMQRILRSGARPGRVPGPRSQPGRPAADGTRVRRAQARAATGGKSVRLHSNGDRSAAFRAELKTNVTRQQLMTSMNRYDQRLYAVAKARFCSDLAASGLLDEDPAARQESAGICGVDLHTLIDPGLA